MISADCIASAIVAACAETGADPLDVMDPSKRGPLQQPIVNARRAVMLGWPGPRNAILTLAARLKWWKTVSTAKSVLKQAIDLGEADGPAARAAAEAYAEFLAPDPEPDPDPVAAPNPKTPARAAAFKALAQTVIPAPDADRPASCSPVVTIIASEEADMIAAYIAKNGVTHCPTGHAAGTSAMETQFFAAPPPRPDGSWRASNAAARAQAKARREGRAA
jgi:hypothetical protein